ncbi:hypothetical protein D3C79_915500 [compost metagenome]
MSFSMAATPLIGLVSPAAMNHIATAPSRAAITAMRVENTVESRRRSDWAFFSASESALATSLGSSTLIFHAALLLNFRSLMNLSDSGCPEEGALRLGLLRVWVFLPTVAASALLAAINPSPVVMIRSPFPS